MKTSRIVLWTGAAFLALLILVSLIAVKISLGTDLGPAFEEEQRYSGEETRIPLDVEDVRRVALQGGWQVKIVSGEESGMITIPVEAEEHLRVEKRGGDLFIGLERGFRIGEEAPYLIKLTLTSLEKLEIEGAADVRMEDLVSDRLEIRLAGASNLVALGCRAEELLIRSEGASNLDLDASRFVNADLRMDGASNVEIELDGGVLEGRISGIASVVYGGKVSDFRLRTEGPASVERR